ncbi:MAG: hypothetical protein J0M12_13960 [Deltaproteobacteria bacterium]|nr:hypothetical protein [Deltaproteobacteria bacterium]
MARVASSKKAPTLLPSPQLRCFAVLWALSSLFQLFAQGSVVLRLTAGTWAGVIELALAFAAGMVIWQPRLTTLAPLCLLQIANAYLLLPELPNNRLLTALVNLSILLAMLCNLGPDRERRERNVYIDFSHCARLILIIFYGFAVFAKLNSGFLDASVSCASAFYLRLSTWFWLTPHSAWAAKAAIYVTIVCEFLIPICLIFGRTRSLGIALGLLFHSALSLDYYQHTMDFGSLLFALYFLFTPENFLEDIRKTLFGRYEAEHLQQDFSHARFFLLLSCGLVLTTAFMSVDFGPWPFFYSRHILWYSYALFVLLAYFANLLFSRSLSAPLSSPFRQTHPLLFLPILLTIANGMGPYVGLKTRSSFDMYSNLRTEPPHPNHLLFGTSLDLFGFQSDRVRIIESNDPWLQKLSKDKFELSYFEFAKFLAKSPGTTVRYSRNGVVSSVSNEQERQALEMPSAFTRKILWFRPIDTQDAARCDW